VDEMPFVFPLEKAEEIFPEYEFVSALPASAQKAAFEVRAVDGAHLCLKIIAPDYGIDRLEREILALQAMDHPNVGGMVEYTFSTKGGIRRHYMIEEFIEGSDLSEYLKDGQAWSLDKIASFFLPLLDGLAAIHDIRIVHRDLKPSNIRIRNNMEPVIIDLGLARHLDKIDITKTEQGATIGTPAYFSPEQFIGTKHDIDHRTDLFAVGILMYQLAVCHHPFLENDMTYDHLQKRVLESDDHLANKIFSDLPNEWKLLISKMLERERVKRPASARQIQTVLMRIGTK
jgi:serine/threonine-protein kinase